MRLRSGRRPGKRWAASLGVHPQGRAATQTSPPCPGEGGSHRASRAVLPSRGTQASTRPRRTRVTSASFASSSSLHMAATSAGTHRTLGPMGQALKQKGCPRLPSGKPGATPPAVTEERLLPGATPTLRTVAHHTPWSLTHDTQAKAVHRQGPVRGWGKDRWRLS